MLSALTRAVGERERARRHGSADARSALESRTALIKARWTLIDEYERDGERFIVARVNPPLPKPHPALSSRERQVAQLAALGRSNKLIAYELGLAHSTVRVLVQRACAKLGLRSRADLVNSWSGPGS